jgi:hypothetical protein
MSQLTSSSICHRFSRNCENGKQLCHNFRQQLRKCVNEWDPKINVQTLEKQVDTLKEVHDRVVTGYNVLDNLKVEYYSKQMVTRNLGTDSLREEH